MTESDHEQSKNNRPRKKITLKDYVKFLNKVSTGKVTKTAHLKGIDKMISKSLEDEGLITKGVFKFSSASVGIANDVIITPSGAGALVEWTEVLRENSIWNKFLSGLLSGLSRIFWIAIGWIGAVAAPSITKTIKPIIDEFINKFN